MQAGSFSYTIFMASEKSMNINVIIFILAFAFPSMSTFFSTFTSIKKKKKTQYQTFISKGHLHSRFFAESKKRSFIKEVTEKKILKISTTNNPLLEGRKKGEASSSYFLRERIVYFSREIGFSISRKMAPLSLALHATRDLCTRVLETLKKYRVQYSQESQQLIEIRENCTRLIYVIEISVPLQNWGHQ